MTSLLAATQNQTRLCAIQTLEQTLHNSYPNHSGRGYLFPDFNNYYNQHSELCVILISILKGFNRGSGVYAISLGGRTQTISQPELQNYIILCIHQLTGMKPKVANTSDGKPAFWLE